jgi:hypothetical protein
MQGAVRAGCYPGGGPLKSFCPAPAILPGPIYDLYIPGTVLFEDLCVDRLPSTLRHPGAPPDALYLSVCPFPPPHSFF